jgi:hypothetical protein
VACGLASVADFRKLCPSQSGVANPSAEMALSAASVAAERYCGRSFAQAAATEFYDGNGYPELPLNRWPISSVASVYLDTTGGYGQVTDSFGAATLLTAGQDYCYVAAKGALQLLTGRLSWPISGIGPGYSPWGYPGLTRRGTSWVGWPKLPGCVKVTYTAGYQPIPADLVSAVCAMAAYILISADAGGLITTSQSYIDTSVGSGFLTEALARGNVPALGSARAVLDSYRDLKINRGVF